MVYRVTIRKEGAPDEVRLMTADTHFAVYEAVGKEGGVVIDVEDRPAGLAVPAWLTMTIGTGVKRQEVVRMAKNLSSMLSAGLSISRALSVIERQSSNKVLKKIAAGLAESVKKGASFHEALAAYPKIFPDFLVAMARAGEESGSLADALTVVGLQMERADELTRKIRGAMIYPAIVITAVTIVGVLMLIYVVPTLTKTFKDLGVQVPLATQIIVMISDFMAAHATLVLLGMVGIIGGIIAFVRSKVGSAIVLSASLYIPVIGELVRETFTARAARTLSSLLASGVPVLNALAITREVVSAPKFAVVIADAATRVKRGDPLSAAFAEHSNLYPLQMSDMLSVGEETGKVAEMLKQIAEFYEQDVAEKTKDLSTIIEPVLMLIIGTFVGIFAVSMIAPIYQLSSAIG